MTLNSLYNSQLAEKFFNFWCYGAFFVSYPSHSWLLVFFLCSFYGHNQHFFINDFYLFLFIFSLSFVSTPVSKHSYLCLISEGQFRVNISQKFCPVSSPSWLQIYIFLLLVYWGYIVLFAEVLTIYHSCVHPFHHSPFFPSPPFLEFSTSLIFPFLYMSL
jgi:hypothetical protein